MFGFLVSVSGIVCLATFACGFSADIFAERIERFALDPVTGGGAFGKSLYSYAWIIAGLSVTGVD